MSPHAHATWPALAAYVDLVRELTQSLEDSILADLNGAEEREVRARLAAGRGRVWRGETGCGSEESGWDGPG